MDSNVRTPLQWDWENLIMFNTSPNEPHRKRLATGWEMGTGGGIESVVPCFSGFDGGNSGSGSNFWHAALSKSSQSTSINSSPLEVKTSTLTSDNHEYIPGDFSCNIEFSSAKASLALEASADSAEPGLSLKLGKRTCFEDVCGGNNNEDSTVSMNLISSILPVKKSKSSGQSIQIFRCQVEGCNLDLSSAKDYHRKNRVCESHSKCPKVIVGGLERRFCQQCSRFHALSEFDEKKRSCRKRLSHHNARRRKPQPGVFPFNPAGMSDGRQHTNIVWNRLPLHTKAEEKFTWEGTPSMKPAAKTEGFTLSCPKVEGIPRSSQPPNCVAAYHDAKGFPARKENMISFQAPSKGGFSFAGAGEFSVSSGLDGTQDFHRALSLLSITSWDSCEPKHFSIDHHTKNPESPTQPLSQAFPTLFL